jgi:hypothetical protein
MSESSCSRCQELAAELALSVHEDHEPGDSLREHLNHCARCQNYVAAMADTGLRPSCPDQPRAVAVRGFQAKAFAVGPGRRPDVDGHATGRGRHRPAAPGGEDRRRLPYRQWSRG